MCIDESYVCRIYLFKYSSLSEVRVYDSITYVYLHVIGKN